jgi:uncharacterized protein (TIRG00374 family)
VSVAKKIWQTGWRVTVGALLLLWIFHSIFVNEAREQSKRGELIVDGSAVDAAKWQQLPRQDQWRYGWKFGPPALWKTLRSVDGTSLGLSFLLMGMTLLIGIVRWRIVLRVQGLGLPFGRAAEISLVAHFFNSFLLGTAGGDVMKAYYAARETHHKKTEAVVTVFADRLVGLWAMLLFASLMIAPNFHLFQRPGLRTVALAVVMMTVAASGFAFLAFRGGVSRKWSGAREWLRRLPKGEWLERSLESCREFGRQRGFVPRALGLSMLANVVCVFQFWVLSRGLNMNVPLLPLALIVPTVICISALPISPSGLGVRENLFVQLLAAQNIGADPTDSLSLSLLAFAGSLFWSLIGGIVYMIFKEKHHLRENELASE